MTVLLLLQESVNREFTWAISNIYGPHNVEERQVLWQELKIFRSSYDGS